jgi:LuxR family transcriptional regulator, maltose regulon positive regulatory protein
MPTMRLVGRASSTRRASPAAAAGEPDALLATKLHLPGVRPGFVPRPRLLDRLTAGLAGSLTLVCAPAGFGKTALLADWARGSRRPVAWLSLDAQDNDPARFWRYVAAALERARPGLGGPVAARAGSSEAVVTALVNQLAAAPDPVALVLDDYHLIEAPPRPWPPAPRGGRSGCSWPRCRCGTGATRRGSWPP